MLSIFGTTGNVDITETPRMILRTIKESKIPLGLVGQNSSGKSILLKLLQFDVDEIIDIRTNTGDQTIQLIRSLSNGKQTYFSIMADSNHRAIESLKYYVGIVEPDIIQKAFSRPIALAHMVKTNFNSKVIEKISIYPEGIGINKSDTKTCECLYLLQYQPPKVLETSYLDSTEIVTKPSGQLCYIFPAFEKLK